MTEPVAAARGQPNSGDLADQARGLILAGLITALAGMVDVIGYLHLSRLFVSFMSGNSTRLGAALGRGDLAEGGSMILLIGLFVIGAAAGQVLAGFTGRWHLACVLVAVAILLAIAALSETTPEPMVLAMGALNASMHRAGRVGGLTYVTGTLVKFGQGLGDFLTRRSSGWNWLAQASSWVGMIAGATSGSAAYVQLGGAVIWVPVVLATILAAWAAAKPEPD